MTSHNHRVKVVQHRSSSSRRYQRCRLLCNFLNRSAPAIIFVSLFVIISYEWVVSYPTDNRMVCPCCMYMGGRSWFFRKDVALLYRSIVSAKGRHVLLCVRLRCTSLWCTYCRCAFLEWPPLSESTTVFVGATWWSSVRVALVQHEIYM